MHVQVVRSYSCGVPVWMCSKDRMPAAAFFHARDAEDWRKLVLEAEAARAVGASA